MISWPISRPYTQHLVVNDRTSWSFGTVIVSIFTYRKLLRCIWHIWLSLPPTIISLIVSHDVLSNIYIYMIVCTCRNILSNLSHQWSVKELTYQYRTWFSTQPKPICHFQLHACLSFGCFQQIVFFWRNDYTIHQDFDLKSPHSFKILLVL